MALPRINMDFNERIEDDLVILAKTDTCLDDKGDFVNLSEDN
jgi:hypothetical protein